MINDWSLFRTAVADELKDAILSIDQSGLDDLVDSMVSARRIFTAGVGQAGLLAKVLAMMVVQLGKAAFSVGDVTTPSIQEGDLLIIISYSGTTKTCCVFAKQAKSLNIRLALVTAHCDSEIAKLADTVVLVRSASDDIDKRASVNYTGDGFVQVMMPLIYCIVRMTGQKISAGEETMIKNHANLE
jgi:6-phospho-3-hexuloisomerase